MLAVASGALVTTLAVLDIVDWREMSHLGAPAWLLWIAVAYFTYRHLIRDVFMLAGGVLSVIVVMTVFLAHHLTLRDASAYLLIGMLVIGLSAAGGYWLRQVAAEGEA